MVGVGLGGTAGLLIVLLGLPGIRGIGLCGGVVLWGSGNCLFSPVVFTSEWLGECGCSCNGGKDWEGRIEDGGGGSSVIGLLGTVGESREAAAAAHSLCS